MAGKKKQPKKDAKALAGTPKASLTPAGGEFDEVLALIEAARSRAVAAVNHELVDLY